MAEGAVYSQTTVPKSDEAKSCCTPGNLQPLHLVLKVSQLVFSFVAFVCEEVIEECEQCAGLYIFEFVSCSALLFCLLNLVLYCTPLLKKFNGVAKIDCWIILCISIVFFIASIIFAATMDNVVLSKVSVAFGFIASFTFVAEIVYLWKIGKFPPKTRENENVTNQGQEGQPLNLPIQVQEHAHENA